MKNKALVLLAFLQISALLLPAQRLPFRNFQAKDGLPSSEVYFALQDHLGYMWFSTDAGISRYDGYSFKNFNTNDGLCDNTVFQLFEDRHQRIWCRSISGCISYLENDRFITIAASERIRREKANLLLTELYVDHHDTLWLGTQNRKIIRIAPPYTDANVSVFESTQTEVRLIGQGLVYALASLVTSAGGEARMILHISTNGRNETLTDTLPHSFIIRYLHETATSTLLVAGKKLYRYENGQLTELYNSPGIILSLCKDAQQRLWLGLVDQGLLLIEPQPGGRYKTRHHYLDKERVSFITRDFEGGTWICSLKNGVYYLPRQGIEQFTGNNSDDNRMIGVAAIGNRVFSSNYNGELLTLRPDSIDLHVEKIIQEETEITKKLFVAGGDSLLAAGTSLLLIRPTGNSSTLLLPRLQDGTLTDMVHAQGSDWWVANPVRVNLVNIRNGAVTDSFKIEGTRVNTLFLRNDTLWLGCLDGLWSRSKGRLHYYGQEFPALKNRIDDIISDGAAGMVLATRSSGVLLFDGKQCRAIGRREGLSSLLCKSLLAAGPGQFWIGTNNGLNLLRLDPFPHVSRLIASGDGVAASDVAQLCFSEGKLCAATTNGIFMIDTADCFSIRDIPPIIHLTGVTIREKQGAPDSLFLLAYDQNSVQFDFLGISFRSNGRIIYRYRLEGLDTTWTSSQSTFARYASLAPGDYRFVVYAINGNGLAGQPQTVSLHIASPYWMRWWFITGSLALFLLLTWLVIRSRVRRARLLARKDAEFKQRLAETELKALRAQMNPHFVFNAIGSIQNFILNNKNEDANKYLLIFAQLIRNVLDQSKEELITLKQETETLKLYLGIESLRFKNKFSWQIHAGENCDTETLLVPPLLLQPFVENALWHGLMTAEMPGELLISIRCEGEKLVCLVEDNGIGRKASAELKTGKKRHLSMGTGISKDRLAAMEELLGRKTELEITDLYTKDGRACGTRVRIVLPLLKLS